jgi:hypothetical protein
MYDKISKLRKKLANNKSLNLKEQKELLDALELSTSALAADDINYDPLATFGVGINSEVFDTSVKNTFNIHITIADGKSCKQ